MTASSNLTSKPRKMVMIITLDLIILVILQNSFGYKASGYKIKASKYIEINQSRILSNNGKMIQSPSQISERKYNPESGNHFQQHNSTPSVQRVRVVSKRIIPIISYRKFYTTFKLNSLSIQ